MFSRLAERLCEALASRLDKRTIYRDDGKPYLERYYLIHSTRFKYIPGIYLHKFLSSDEDPELHDHPWGTSISVILTGGYLEERREEDDTVTSRLVRPGFFNLIRKNDFHRVDLIKDHAWTLFIAGKRKQDWGFWNRDTGVYTPWRKFVMARNHQPLTKNQD